VLFSATNVEFDNWLNERVEFDDWLNERVEFDDWLNERVEFDDWLNERVELLLLLHAPTGWHMADASFVDNPRITDRIDA
jgi:hypothetical protein